MLANGHHGWKESTLSWLVKRWLAKRSLSHQSHLCPLLNLMYYTEWETWYNLNKHSNSQTLAIKIKSAIDCIHISSPQFQMNPMKSIQIKAFIYKYISSFPLAFLIIRTATSQWLRQQCLRCGFSYSPFLEVRELALKRSSYSWPCFILRWQKMLLLLPPLLLYVQLPNCCCYRPINDIVVWHSESILYHFKPQTVVKSLSYHDAPLVCSSCYTAHVWQRQQIWKLLLKNTKSTLPEQASLSSKSGIIIH